MKNMKRYWIWNPITHKIIINKDVTFDETLLLSIHKQYRKEKNISEDTSKVVQVDVNVVESSNNEKKKKKKSQIWMVNLILIKCQRINLNFIGYKRFVDSLRDIDLHI